MFAWGPIPRTRSLFSHLNEYPVLGVAVLSQERIRLLTWTDGIAEEHPDLLAEVLLEEWPAPSSASSGGRGEPNVEIREANRGGGRGEHRGESRSGERPNSSPSAFPAGPEAASPRRSDDRTRRFLHASARRIPEVGGHEGWQVLLLIGSGALAATLTEHLPESWRRRQIPAIDRNLLKSSVAEIAEAAGSRLAERNREVETAEVDGLVNDARSGGRAVLGVKSTLELLEQRRVDRLFFCSDLNLGGFADPQGRLFEFRAHAPGPVTEEPHLLEQMISRALESGASVTPLTGEPARKLALLGGVGARLRWKGAGAGLFPEVGP
jgi:hypothetical protein